MKTFIIIFAIIALPVCCLAQITIKDTAKLPFFKDAVQASFKLAPQFDGSKLDSIGKVLRNGNKTALLTIAPYLDDTSRVTRFLGYHILKPRQKDVALDLITENVSFLQSEINLDPKTSAAEWLKFTDANLDKITFDADADVFLLTPMSRRDVQIEALELTYLRNGDLHRAADRLLNLPWLKDGEIDMLIGLKDNYALYKIAARLYRNRYRFDEYHNDAADYINLLQLLTGVDVGVRNEKGEITHHIEKEFFLPSRENLLIFFAKNYEAFQWDATKNVFMNSGIKAAPPLRIASYFERLQSETDTAAMNAFIYLTTCNPAEVIKLADNYNKASIDANGELPSFPYRFLKQMVLLTDYCKRNNIDFKGTESLRQLVQMLRGELSFAKRRQLEDKIVVSLSLKDITAFEYWSLLYEQDFHYTHSAGRIIDIFYSKNWSKIIADKTQLNLYLKKSKLYHDLSISGTGYNYLLKFVKTGNPTLERLNALRPVDNDVVIQLPRAIALTQSGKSDVNKAQKPGDTNSDNRIKDFKGAFDSILRSSTNKDTLKYAVKELLEKINYQQLGTAVKLLEPVNFFSWKWEKYAFLDSDFGFTFTDFEDSLAREEFLNYYTSHSEYEVYSHYLNKAGVTYLHTNGKLNYDKVYDILKYNVVTAFVGGGGGKRNNEVYLMVKLLELTFKTTLGFPKKLCHSGDLYSCNANERAKEWMNYLKEKGLLKLPHNEPYSFSYFDN